MYLSLNKLQSYVSYMKEEQNEYFIVLLEKLYEEETKATWQYMFEEADGGLIFSLSTMDKKPSLKIILYIQSYKKCDYE